MKIPVNTQLTGTLNTNQNSVQFLHKQFIKHCQRHNGPRVLTLATCIGSKFGQLYVVPLVLVGGATRIGSKFGQHVMQFALVPILATRWRYLHGHQMALLALVTNLATRWRHLH